MALSVGELLGYISIKGLSEAVSGLSAVRGGFTESGVAADRMAAGVRQTESALVGAGRASNVGAEGSAKFRAAQLSALAATERYNTVLTDESATLRQLALAEAGVIRANERVAASTPTAAITRTNASVKETPGLMARTSRGMLEAAKSAVGLGVAFGAFEAVKKVVDSGKDLTTALNGVQAASHATDQQMTAVRAQAIGLGKDLTVPKATAIDAADAIQDLVRSGMTLPRAMAAARPALLLASAAQVDTADSARFLGDTLDDFQLPASQAAHVANVLAGAATSAGGGLADMFEAIKYAGPYARAANVPVEDLVTTVAELAKGGIQGSMAGTGLRMMLQKLAAPTDASNKALSDLGVTAFDAQGKFVGLRSVIGQLHGAQERFGGDSKKFLADISTAFGARASTIVASLAHKGVEGYDQFAARVRSGDVQKYADLMNRGVAASFDQLKKQFTAAGIDIYSSVEPGLNKVLQLTSKAIPEAVEIGTAVLHPFVAGWHGLADVLGPVGGLFGHMLSAMHPVLPVLEFITKDVLLTWAAFKGYTAARAAATAVRAAVVGMSADFRGAVTAVRQYGAGVQNTLAGVGTESDIAAKQLQADTLAVGAAAQREAAEVDRAAATQAEAYANLVAASDDATASMIVNSQNQAQAAQEAAAASEAAAAETAAAADAAAVELTTAGESAALGWSELLGPIAAVGIGIGLLTTLFHKNSSSEKEASAANEAYGNSLKQNANALAAVNTQATVKQLQDQKSFHLLHELHDANVLVGTSQGDLVLAVNKGGQAYDQLHAKLAQVIKDNTVITRYSGGKGGGSPIYGLNAVGKAATSLSGDIDTLRDSFSKQQRQQMLAQNIERQAQTLADGGASAAARQAKALGLTSNAYLDAQQAAKQSTAQTRQQVAAFQAENDAASLLQQALEGIAGINLTVATAQTSLASANLQVRSSFKDNGSAIKGNTQAAVNNQQAIQGSVQAAEQYAEAVGKQTHSSVQAKAALKQSQSALEDQLRAQGKLTPAVQAYIEKLFNLSNLHVKPTKLDADDAAAEVKIKRMQSDINAIRQGKVPGLTADNSAGAARVAQLQTEINNMRQGRPPVVTVDTSEFMREIALAQSALNRLLTGGHATVSGTGSLRGTLSGGAHGAYATGGTVVGLGTDTSDSVIIRASRDEEVTPARQARKFRPLLKAIARDAVPGYAGGGTVGNRQAQITAYLANVLHFARNGIAATEGNWMVESHLNPAAFNPSENAHGLSQDEGGRWTAMQRLAERMGLSTKSMALNLANFRREIKQYPDLLHALQAGTASATALAARFDSEFERSSGSTHGERMSNARRIAAQLKGQNLGAGPVVKRPYGHREDNDPHGRQAPTPSNPTTVIPRDTFKLITPTLASFAKSAAATVHSAIAQAVKPVDGSTSSLAAQAKYQANRATGLTQVSEQARVVYNEQARHAAKLTQTLANLRNEQRKDVDALRAHATAQSNEAHKAEEAYSAASRRASAMPSSTKAEKAAKQEAEDHAAALKRVADNEADAARTASQRATSASRANAVQVAGLEKLQQAATRAASKAKDAWGTAASAAKDAQKAAEQAATALVSSLQSQADALTDAVSGVKQALAEGLTQGSDLASVWGAVTQAQADATDNLTTANQNLADAKQAVADAQAAVDAAQPDTSSLAAASAAAQQAQNQYDVARAALAAANAAVASGAASSAQFAAVTAAQQRQTDTLTALTAANADLVNAEQAVSQATGPTQDDIDALTSAQTALQVATDAASAAAAAAASNTGSYANLQAQFNATLAATQSFATDLTKLASEGAGQDLISQIAAMGTTAGDQLAQVLLAAGPDGVKALQTTMTEISNVAGKESDALAQGFYSAGANSLQQLVAGMMKKFPDIKAALAPLVAQLQAEFTFTPTVIVPGGSSATNSTGQIDKTKTYTVTGTTTLGALSKSLGIALNTIDALNSKYAHATAPTVIAGGTKLTIPGFADGVLHSAGGIARVHRDEMLVNLAPRTSVFPSNRSIIDNSDLVAEMQATNARLDKLAGQIGEVTLAGFRAAGHEQGRALAAARRGRG